MDQMLINKHIDSQKYLLSPWNAVSSARFQPSKHPKQVAPKITQDNLP